MATCLLSTMVGNRIVAIMCKTEETHFFFRNGTGSREWQAVSGPKGLFSQQKVTRVWVVKKNPLFFFAGACGAESSGQLGILIQLSVFFSLPGSTMGHDGPKE